jgi:hypothetical protein
LHGTHELLVYTDDVNILGGHINTIKKKALSEATREVGLEGNREKTIVVSYHFCAGQIMIY